MHKVIKYFTDLHDNNHPYNVGDEYPRKGIEVTEERIAELASEKNKQGVPLIKLEEEEKAPEADKQAEESEEKAPKKKSAKRGSKKATE